MKNLMYFILLFCALSVSAQNNETKKAADLIMKMSGKSHSEDEYKIEYSTEWKYTVSFADNIMSVWKRSIKLNSTDHWSVEMGTGKLWAYRKSDGSYWFERGYPIQPTPDQQRAIKDFTLAHDECMKEIIKMLSNK
jgi:hypothetical protein